MRAFFGLFGVLVIGFPVFGVSFNPKQIEIPHNQQLKIPLKTQTSDYTVDIYNPDIATIEVDKRRHIVTLTGRAVGQTILMAVDDQGQLSAARVLVKKPAGKIPQFLKIQLSGQSVSSDQAEAAVYHNLWLQTQGDPKRELILGPWRFNQALHNGEWGVAQIAATLRGENLYDVTRNVTVLMQNRTAKRDPDQYLFVSNNPEVVDEPGILFESQLAADESARLIYHHGNLMGHEMRYLSVHLENESEKPVQVLVTDGVGGPSADSLFVGHSATKRFMENDLSYSGTVIDIPAGKSCRYLTQKMPAGQYLSGIIRVSVLDGDGVAVILKAEDQLLAAPDRLLAKDNVKSHLRGQVAFPAHTVETKFQLSDQFQSFEMGMEPVWTTPDDEKLVGNYGVIHRYHVVLENDLEEAQELAVLVSPRGGFARGCYVINQELVETKVLDPYEGDEALIYKVELKPFERQTVQIQTLPQPGSYYPVRLILKAQPVEPANT